MSLNKSLIAVAALLPVCLTSAAHAAIVNVLVNPGFETGSLSPWFQDRIFNGPITTPWGVTSSDAHSGTFSAMDNGNAELKQTFAPIDVAAITDVSFWIKHPSASVGAVAFEFFYTDGSDHEFDEDTNNTDWNFYDMTSDLTAGLQLNGISIFGNSAGVTFLDDISVLTNVNVATGVPEPLTLSVFGAGFVGAIAMRRRKKQSC